MDITMGLSVPEIKAALSHDLPAVMGHTVQMAQPDEDAIEIAWQEQFRARLKQARGERRQQDMADLLCISRDAYAKYEGSRGTVMPVRLLPKFCKICAVSLEWLIEGDKSTKVAKTPIRPAKISRQR
jgi:hypothetical protein